MCPNPSDSPEKAQTRIEEELRAFIKGAHANGWPPDRIERECEEFWRLKTWKVIRANSPGWGERWISDLDGEIDYRVEHRFNAVIEELLLVTPPGGEKAKGNPEVAKRRSLVKNNSGISAEEMCEIFDRGGVPLPEKWIASGYTKWSEAYKDATYRGRIDSMISKDKTG
jgi:hypothetical protein